MLHENHSNQPCLHCHNSAGWSGRAWPDPAAQARAERFLTDTRDALVAAGGASVSNSQLQAMKFGDLVETCARNRVVIRVQA